MDAKKLLQNKSICVLPWTGFQLEPRGHVKNCVISWESIGDIHKTHIKDILKDQPNLERKQQMLADSKPPNCSGCYLQEQGRSTISSISSRLYYLREIGSKIDLSLLDKKENFELKHVDLRWTNACNQACVYCGPDLSSKWAQELGRTEKSDKDARQEVKDYVFENISNLKNIYLAGGEPMLMKENLEFLKLLKEKNKECSVRVNTNLSTTNTGIFDLLCELPNVHWTISVETTQQEYEYIRHHGSWSAFQKNLEVIRKLNHKISFNMLHFILNYDSLFDCIDHLQGLGFHDNSFIAGPLYTPEQMNLLNLPSPMIENVIKKIQSRLEVSPRGYLKNSYENLISYYQNTPWTKNIKAFVADADTRDKRRGLECRKVFPKLFEELHEHRAD